MTRILAIDLGKFKSVSCLLDTTTNASEFWTLSTDRHYLQTVLKNYTPELVVIESCGLAGWVHDVCTAEGYEVLVCNPNQEAWKWKNVKRKTDRDDALKLAKLAALGQLVPVYVPSQQQREYRRLVKYRKVLVGRVNRVQNNIRAIFAQRGIDMVRGQKAWALERHAQIADHRKPLAECAGRIVARRAGSGAAATCKSPRTPARSSQEAQIASGRRRESSTATDYSRRGPEDGRSGRRLY